MKKTKPNRSVSKQKKGIRMGGESKETKRKGAQNTHTSIAPNLNPKHFYQYSVVNEWKKRESKYCYCATWRWNCNGFWRMRKKKKCGIFYFCKYIFVFVLFYFPFSIWSSWAEKDSLIPIVWHVFMLELHIQIKMPLMMLVLVFMLLPHTGAPLPCVSFQMRTM